MTSDDLMSLKMVFIEPQRNTEEKTFWSWWHLPDIGDEFTDRKNIDPISDQNNCSMIELHSF